MERGRKTPSDEVRISKQLSMITILIVSVSLSSLFMICTAYYQHPSQKGILRTFGTLDIDFQVIKINDLDRKGNQNTFSSRTTHDTAGWRPQSIRRSSTPESSIPLEEQKQNGLKLGNSATLNYY